MARLTTFMLKKAHHVNVAMQRKIVTIISSVVPYMLPRGFNYFVKLSEQLSIQTILHGDANISVDENILILDAIYISS
jgi:hypothetical protein